MTSWKRQNYGVCGKNRVVGGSGGGRRGRTGRAQRNFTVVKVLCDAINVALGHSAFAKTLRSVQQED